jgi:hypothetical protein
MSLPTRSRSRSPAFQIPSSSKTRRSPVVTRSKSKTKVEKAPVVNHLIDDSEDVIDISQFATNSPGIKPEPKKRGRPPKNKGTTER